MANWNHKTSYNVVLHLDLGLDPDLQLQQNTDPDDLPTNYKHIIEFLGFMIVTMAIVAMASYGNGGYGYGGHDCGGYGYGGCGCGGYGLAMAAMAMAWVILVTSD